jgi:hypothetical protein
MKKKKIDYFVENFETKNTWLYVLIIIVTLSFFVIPILLTQLSWFIKFDAESGAIGDTIGGIVNPIVALIAVIATFLAFYVQYKANQFQFRANTQQNHNFKLQQFESTFFELLRTHRENADEQSFEGSKGRAAFFEMFKLFERFYQNLSGFDEATHYFSKRERINIAYYAVYFGIGWENAAPVEFRQKVTSLLLEKGVGVYTSFRNTIIDVVKKVGPEGVPQVNRNYVIGLQPTLSHYHRHLYQTVKFVHNTKFLKEDKKYQYLKTLRAQLSAYEQGILLINSLTSLGKMWEVPPEGEDMNLITRYQLIKNMPWDIMEIVKPKEFYPKINYEIEE